MDKDYWMSDEFFRKREEQTLFYDSSKDSEEIEKMLNQLQIEIFEKQKFKEQEEIRDNYYKLLTLENNKSKM